MRLTTKGRYGVRILLDLAQNQNSGPVSMTDVAQRQGVSMKYLERIVGELRRAGFVTSVRGRSGGHKLALPPENITVGDIVRALESGGVALACGKDRRKCSRSAECLMRSIWIEADQAVFERLDSISILDIMQDNLGCMFGGDGPDSSSVIIPAASAQPRQDGIALSRRLNARRRVVRRAGLGGGPVASHARKIMVVDDDPDVVEYLESLFRDNGYATCSAPDGTQAMSVLRRERPDLITLDLEMPGAWGPRFHMRMRQIDEFRHIPVVVISGLAEAHKAIPEAFGAVQKPFESQEVLRLVHLALG